MKKSNNIIKLFYTIVSILVIQHAIASLSSTTAVSTASKSNKYSLKKLNQYNTKYLSLSYIRTSLNYKNSIITTQKSTTSGLTLNSMMQFDRGNTTYVYPYTFKVKLPKFKTPTPPSF